MSLLGTFEHTTGKTWGGTQITPTVLMATSILGGFFGLDHILLRSPRTALFKFILNILSLGLWYWYDVVQVTTDMDSIKSFGYTIPLVGPVGLGAGIVGDPSGGAAAAPEGTPSPWMFLLFVLFGFLPFGINNFLAGDTYGGAAKLLTTYIIFTTIFGLLWTVYSAFYTIFDTESLLTKGTDRPFPFSLFMDRYGYAPSLMPPKLEEVELEMKEPGLIEQVINFFTGWFEKPVLEAAVAVVEPIVDAAQTTKNAATEATAAPEPATNQVGGALNAATSAAVMMSAQQGGAIASSSKYVFLAASALIFIGSVSLTYFRFWRAKKNSPIHHINKNDFPPEQNDTPPGPRVL